MLVFLFRPRFPKLSNDLCFLRQIVA